MLVLDFLQKDCTKIFWTPTSGIGQQPYWPVDNLQQVVPSGHSEVPPGHTTSVTTDFAAVFSSQGMDASCLLHVPAATSHVYPLGQQWTPSEQHTACGIGQHPYSPVGNLQQAVPSGHVEVPPGHTTSVTTDFAAVFSSQGMDASCLSHVPAATSHVYPLGQQWTPSEQHTACGIGQHPYSPVGNLQQVVPSGHVEVPPGHVTSVTTDFAAVFSSQGMDASCLLHVPAATSHVYPLGQQWTPSEQHTACGIGQHPYSPVGNLQQVVPSGHSEVPPGHTTSVTTDFAAVFSSQGMDASCLLHVPAATSHVYPLGQQWTPSEQHTAYNKQG